MFTIILLSKTVTRRNSSICAVWVLISFVLLKFIKTYSLFLDVSWVRLFCHGEGGLGFAIVHHFYNLSRIFLVSLWVGSFVFKFMYVKKSKIFSFSVPSV